MSRTNWQWSPLRMLPAFFWAIAIAIGISGCSDGVGTSDGSRSSEPLAAASEPQIVEVSPPRAIAELRRDLEIYRPQVSILSPKPDTVFEGETVTVQLQVRDLPIFKNDRFGLGPHLNVILDNQPEITVYDPNEPLVLEDVSPGTHTLRVFASRPWHESFKNEGAYAQTTFHVYTRTDDNHPDSALPLLTYSRPAGRYGAEPILFDYYLTNAPLHLVAQESGQDDIVDWQVRWTIDGKSFSSDRWQPIYLKGFAPGKHWVQLEFLDELGNPVKNAFNNTVRTIVYEPGGEDSLSQLVRGKIAVADMRGIVDPLYTEEESTPEEELRPSEMSEEEDVEADTESEVLEEVEPEISEEEATGAETVPGPLEPSELEVSEEETTQTETVPEVPEQPEPTIFEEETTQTETVPEVLDESELEVSEEETTQTETVPEVLEQPEPIIFEEETTPTETVPEVLEQPESEISKEETTEAEPESEVPDESELEVSEEETTEAEPESEVLEESELEVSEEETTEAEPESEGLEQPELEVSEEETTEAETVPEVLEQPELEISKEETTQTETVPEVLEQPELEVSEEETTEAEPESEVPDESELEVFEEEATQTETVPEVLEQSELEVSEEETTPTETVPEVLEQPELEISEEERTEAEPVPEVLEESELEVSEEETTQTETVPEVLEQPELELEVIDEPQVNEDKETESIDNEQIKNIEVMEIELPDLELYPYPLFREDLERTAPIQLEPELGSTLSENSFDGDCWEGSETIENPMETIELT